MAFSAIVQTVIFDASASPKVISINATGTVADGGWKFRYRITAPSGQIIYVNDDWDGDDQSWIDDFVDSNSANPIFASVPIELDANSVPVPGTYLIEWKGFGVTGPVKVEGTFTTVIAFPAPAVEISYDLQVEASQLISKDITNYVVGGVTPAITRTHKVTYPLPVDIAPVENAQANITITPIYEGVFRSDVSCILVYVYPNTKTGQVATVSTSVRTSVRAYSTIEVIYQSLDDINNRLFDLNKRYEQASKNGSAAAALYAAKLNRCAVLVVLYNQAVRAGDDGKASIYYNSLVAILDKERVTTTG